MSMHGKDMGARLTTSFLQTVYSLAYGSGALQQRPGQQARSIPLPFAH